MTLSPELVSAFRFHRARMLNRGNGRVSDMVARARQANPPAVVALELARADVEAGKARYPHDGKAHPAVCGQAPEESKPRRASRIGYVQSIEGAGLRYVGRVATETGWRGSIWNNRDTDTGWITDPHGDVFKDGTGLCWGVVYQLPGRDGKARFVAGYIIGGCSDDLPTVDFGTVYEEDARDGFNDSPQDYDAATDAARAADSMAQRAAEEEREYQTAHAAGSRWNSLGEDIAVERKEALALLIERRKARASGTDFPNICSAVRATVLRILTSIDKARRERAELANGDHEGLMFWPGNKRLQAAFNEGACAKVLS